MKRKYVIIIIVSVLTIALVLSYFWFKNYNLEKDDDSWLNGSGDFKDDNLFNDVFDTYWAKDYILYLTERNIMSGDSSNNFNPESDITCEEFLIMLSKASMPMIDYDKTSIDDLINILIQKNVIHDGEFTKNFLDSKLTNYSAAIMMAKFDINIRNTEQKIAPIKYIDVTSLSDVDKSLVGHSIERGFVKGKDKVKFYPDKKVSRATVAEMIYNFMNL